MAAKRNVSFNDVSLGAGLVFSEIVTDVSVSAFNLQAAWPSQGIANDW